MTARQVSDTLILFLSVTSGRQARDLIKNLVSDPDSWLAWNEHLLTRPTSLQVVGMYEVIGNWDLALFMRTTTNSPKTLVGQVRREILRRGTQLHTYPPVHERGGPFGRFQAITVNREYSSLDLDDLSQVRHTKFPSAADYIKNGHTRTFVVVGDSPDEERQPIGMEMLASGMHQAILDAKFNAPIECVYLGTNRIVIELMSTQSGAVDVAEFNRLIEPVLGEFAMLKYTLLCYEYDEVACGWGI